MNEAANLRKLTTIVAVDVVGFSTRAEADEAAAVDQVTSLGQDAERAARAFGGRVFSSAGDGLMLEFPTVTGAVDAALSLVSRSAAPIRIGVHLGEVIAVTGGDLLGHGVNVASRLQSMAAPRGVIVSNSVWQALRPPQAALFRKQGEVRLDKMSQTLAVYAHTPRGAHARFRRTGRIGLLAALGLAIVVIAAGVWTARRAAPPGPRPLQLSVTALRSEGAATAAAQLSATLRGALMNERVEVVPPAEGVGRWFSRPDLTLGGSVDRDGETLRARLELADARAGATLWSGAVTAPASDPAGFAERVTAATGLVVRCTAKARAAGAGPISLGALSVYLKACSMAEEPNSQGYVMTLYRQVTEAAPQFAPAWADRANWAAGEWRQDPDDRAALGKEVRTAAQRAIALNPRLPTSYLALSAIEPIRAWEAQDSLLERAYALDPTDEDAASTRAYILAVQGRVAESADVQRRAVAAAPYSPVELAQLANVLDSAGSTSDAQAVIDEAFRRWPDNTQVQGVRFWLYAWRDRTDEALAALAQPGASFLHSASEASAWRAVLQARRSGAERDNLAARRAVLATDGEGGIDRFEAIEMLVMLGDNDDALRIGYALAADQDGPPPIWMFRTPTSGLHRDPRFLALAERYGLVSYWRRSGRWPDYCRRTDLPYDCRAEADRLLAG